MQVFQCSIFINKSTPFGDVAVNISPDPLSSTFCLFHTHPFTSSLLSSLFPFLLSCLSLCVYLPLILSHPLLFPFIRFLALCFPLYFSPSLSLVLPTSLYTLHKPFLSIPLLVLHFFALSCPSLSSPVLSLSIFPFFHPPDQTTLHCLPNFHQTCPPNSTTFCA